MLHKGQDIQDKLQNDEAQQNNQFELEYHVPKMNHWNRPTVFH